MSRSKSTPLVLALLILGGGLAYLVVALTGGGAAAPMEVPLAGGRRPDPAPVAAPDIDREDMGLTETVRARGVSEHNIAWPLRVHLDLVEPDYLPSADDLDPIGSGRTAGVQGRIVRGKGHPVAATVRFVAGTNEGRELHAGSDGRFGASDLYPGLQIVTVNGPGIVGSKRYLRLNIGVDTPFNVTYGMAASFWGRVFDDSPDPRSTSGAGRAVEGAKVEMDGQVTVTDEEGYFYFPSMTAGVDLALTIRKEGFATYTELTGGWGARVGVGANIPREAAHVYQLRRAASLDVYVQNKVGGAGDALVVLLPSPLEDPVNNYPWHTVNPRRVKVGRKTTFEDLPPRKIEVRVFHEGAIAEPNSAHVYLQAGQSTTQIFEMKPTERLTGRVLKNGVPQPGATLRLEAPDPVAATCQYFASTAGILQSIPMPLLPPATQTAFADSKGEYMLSTWPKYARGRYLQAFGPDGESWAGRIVRASDHRIDLELGLVHEGAGMLEVEFPKRFQGLPIEVFVNGEPRVDTDLESDEPLVLEGLVEGSWKMVCSWNGTDLWERPRSFRVAEASRQEVVLPTGAIVGQPDDIVKRARGIFD